MKTSRFIYDLTIYNLLFLSLLLASCYQPKVTMKTSVYDRGYSNFVREA